MVTLTWMQWKEEIIRVIRREYCELFPHVQHDDIDWEAWKPLYEQGCTPLMAVSTAFSPTLGRGNDRAA